MVEIIDGKKVDRIYCKQIENFKKETIYPIIETTVAEDAKIVPDEYPTYDNLKEKFKKAKQRKSLNGKSFESLHQQIMNVKGWLRSIHHHCIVDHFQQYLDEFCFRMNRRNTESEIFRYLINKIAFMKSKTFKELKAFAA